MLVVVTRDTVGGGVESICEPDEMGNSPIGTLPRPLRFHGLRVDDVGVWELSIDPKRMNIGVGHADSRRGRNSQFAVMSSAGIGAAGLFELA